MSDYKYINDYEREETQKWEGIYTREEVELNKKLYHACSQNNIDFGYVEELLTQGADPLGGTAEFGWDLLYHVYTELILESQDTAGSSLLKITELFLKHGMNVEKPRIPYDNDNSFSPMWALAHLLNENGAHTLKMLLENGLSAEGFADFWGHAIDDSFYIECVDPQNDVYGHTVCTWVFKMLLFGASYDYILDEDRDLRDFICCDFNSYDIHNFRNWDAYTYYFDTSCCDRFPELYGSIVHIYEKETGKEVWKIGVGQAGRKTLKKQQSCYTEKNN